MTVLAGILAVWLAGTALMVGYLFQMDALSYAYFAISPAEKPGSITEEA